MIEFQWPWIYLLLPLPLLALRWQSKKNHNAIAVLPRLSQAFEQLEKNTSGIPLASLQQLWRLALLWCAWCALLTAIAQPGRLETQTAQPASGRAMVVLIDLSTSMERLDFTMDGNPVDRLTVVKRVAGDFITQRAGDRVGLVLFGSEAFIGSPLSYDLRAVNYILQSSGIGMAGRTTAMGDALGLAIQSLRNDAAVDKAIVLLSDGTNNAGTAEPEDAASLAASLDIRIHTIGLGSDSTAKDQQLFQSASADLDEKTLKAIASESGGRFFRAHTASELETIYAAINTLEQSDSEAPPVIIRQDFRNVFIILLLLFLAPLLITSPVRGNHT